MNKNNSEIQRFWLTWETGRRNAELSTAFGCRYAKFDHSERSTLARYCFCVVQTLFLFLQHRPKVIFAQCPSLLLISLVAVLRRCSRFQFIIDAHNSLFEYLDDPRRIVRALSRFACRQADLVIVSNEPLANIVKRYGWPTAVLPDKLPQISAAPIPEPFAKLQRPICVFISTFAADEPLEEFLQGVSEISEPFTLLVTGRKSKAGELLAHESEKVIFTDFLSPHDYDALIQNADFLIDLTTRENCLVCGAYEALAVGVPILLSDFLALRETFSAAAYYAVNEKEDYRKKFIEFLSHPSKHLGPWKEYRSEFQKKWDTYYQQILLHIE